jgi:uncharacterized protein (DUF952 family)
MALIFKIVPRPQWEHAGESYAGSPHDQADGFLHFSTRAQLPETLRRYYAGVTDLMLVAVEADKLGDALKWEHSASRGEDFPHLYGPLPRSAVIWSKPLNRKEDGEFLLPGDTA